MGFGADFDGIGVIPSDAASVASYPAVIKVPASLMKITKLAQCFTGATGARLEQRGYSCNHQR